MAAVVAAPACENDMNATNVGPSNPLLDGACDDDDNELTAEQKKIIEERLKALQARFKAFEEKTTQQKIDELIMANEAYGLTQEDAEMVLRVCNNNEFEASDRLTEEEDGFTFLNAIRSMVAQEKRAKKLTGRKRQAEEEQLARRTRILRRRRNAQVDVDPDASDYEEEEDWDEDDPSLWEDYADEPVQEMSHGVHFVRHVKTHKPQGGRLRLDDAIAAMQKREQMLKEKKEKEAAEGKSESEPSPDKADKSESEPSPDKPAEKPADEEDKPVTEGADAAPEDDKEENEEVELDPLDELIKGWSEARIKAWNNREKNENQYYYRFNAPGERQGEGKWSDDEHALFMSTLEKVKAGELKDSSGNVVPMYQWGSFSKDIPGRVGYQCSNYYRSLITQNKLEDENYQLDDQGKLRFNFKNKGFTRDEEGRMKKAPAVPKAPRVPKPPKDNSAALQRKREAEAKKKAKAKAKAEKEAERKAAKEDKDFKCNTKFDTVRRSGRSGGTKKYSDGDGSEDEEDLGPVLPGFIDPLTKMAIEEPAISPYGHVCGYEIWCKILRQEGTKDTCPFTRQPLKRRQLVILTHDNIAEYREKMVETQNN